MIQAAENEPQQRQVGGYTGKVSKPECAGSPRAEPDTGTDTGPGGPGTPGGGSGGSAAPGAGAAPRLPLLPEGEAGPGRGVPREPALRSSVAGHGLQRTGGWSGSARAAWPRTGTAETSARCRAVCVAQY